VKRRILITAGLSLALLLCLSGTYTGATAQPPSAGLEAVARREEDPKRARHVKGGSAKTMKR
jgi:hypothetical protein